MLVVSVERRETNNALQHIKRRRPLNPLSPLCLDIIQKIRAAGLDELVRDQGSEALWVIGDAITPKVINI